MRWWANRAVFRKPCWGQNRTTKPPEKNSLRLSFQQVQSALMESPSGLPRINNFIDGQFRDPVNDKWIDNYNPSTGTVYSLVADSDDNDVELAYQAAAKAFPGWKKMPREERSKVLNKIADLIEARKVREDQRF
jgi:delta 1-pyrroline-5-carboxylate dehydrogenase